MLKSLPFQTQYPTYLPKSLLYGSIAVADLPRELHQILALSNGGYLQKNFCPTTEPTSDALDGFYVPYLAGLRPKPVTKAYLLPSLAQQNSFHYRPLLPKESIILMEDKKRVLFLDYQKHFRQPSVRYLDVECDQWQEVAHSFASFWQALQPGAPLDMVASQASYQRFNAAFLTVTQPEELQELFNRAEANFDKTWLFHWLGYFASALDISQRNIAKEALQFQEDFFAPSLPENYPQVKAQFND